MARAKRKIRRAEKLLERIGEEALDFRDRGWRFLDTEKGHPVDCLIALDVDRVDAPTVFEQLRWGGRVLCAGRKRQSIEIARRAFTRDAGYRVDVEPTSARLGPPVLGRRWHYFVARRVWLMPPGKHTLRFTYNVRLTRHERSEHDYAVLKGVPTREEVLERLRQRFRDTDASTLRTRAKKLADHVFPVFLSREVSFLRLLERDMPPSLQGRFPRVLGVEKGDEGLVRRMLMSWLRQGGPALTRLAFAKQAASMLAMVHDRARIIHLDMRLDNMLITPRGVCLVDFGSAVRDDEDIEHTSMLRSLFTQMMVTSEVQQTLGRMKEQGELTSASLIDAHQKIDKQADLFYLVLQLPRADEHSSFKGLVVPGWDPRERELLEQVRDEVIRPRDPENPSITSAAQLLERLEELEAQLALPE